VEEKMSDPGEEKLKTEMMMKGEKRDKERVGRICQKSK